MSKIVPVPLTIPMAGLVCWHDLWFPNILPYSNTFSSWSKMRANVVESASVCAPSGAKAWKLVEDNTAANSHYIYLPALNEAAVCQAVTNTWAIRAKAGERSKLCLLNAALGKAVGFTLSGDGATFQSGVTAVFDTYGIEALDDGWYLCWVQDTFAGGPNSLRVYLLDSEDDLRYDGAGAAPYTEDDPGLYIADTQLYPSATLPPYSATTDLQTFADLSGHGYSLQRGSTAGADSNDPAVLGPGLSFVTDDYCLTPTLTGVDPAAPWTVIVAGIWSMYVAYSTSWSLATADHWQRIFRPGQHLTQTVGQSYDGYGSNTSPILTPSRISPVVLTMVSTDDSLTLIDMATGNSSVGTNRKPTGDCRIGLGCLAKSGVAGIVDSMTVYSHLFYNRALSNAEINRAYRVLKGTWAARGVTIS